MTFRLESTAFREGQRIPERYTCEGQDVSPPLAWSGAPEGTKSFVLLLTDPDAPRGTWHHWGLYDIPADASELAQALPAEAKTGPMRQVLNDFGRVGYGGPCPPPGHGTHHYHFRLLALSVGSLRLPAKARCPDLEKAALPHFLGAAETVGTYARS